MCSFNLQPKYLDTKTVKGLNPGVISKVGRV